ncbi:MAG: hypothetical protein KC486_36230 [Myxococcales bacterium]|nr:hypothetical protein [Myxococcales bacterium]
MTDGSSELPISTPRARGRRRSLVVSALLGVAAFAVAVPAAASEAPFVLRPGSRPLFFLVGAGPSAGIGGQCYDGYYYGGRLFNEPGYQLLGCGGAIKLSQEFGAHFSGYAAGPAAGVVVQQELLGYGYFGLTVAPKFTWDIQVLKDIGLYVSPNVAIGYHRSRWQGHPAFTGGDIQGGVALKLALGDRGLVYTQLPHFDFVFGPGYSMVRYDFILGVGLSF